MDISEFLLARISDAEGVVRQYRQVWDEDESSPFHPFVIEKEGPYLSIDPAYVLAECEAKRRIINAAWADHLQIEGEWGYGRGREDLSALNDYPEVVTLLALPYADHPDYDEEWRPRR
jgi:hypothetical protein